MLHILARIHCTPEGAATVRDIMVELAAASRQESGCEGYEVYQRADDPTQFQTVELWRDQAAVDAHMSTPHVAAAIARGGPLFAAPPLIQPFLKLV
jgi:quinol monooxygenase YgiN